VPERERGARAGADTSHVFSKSISAQVRRIEIRTRGLVEALFSGEYHSVFKGRGLEFSDVREYQPGDDVRAIDWNVTARRGRPFVKEYVEERELTVLLIVDLSASKEFGTGEKSNAVIASEIAAVLALAAAGNNDRVGLLLVTDRVEKFIPPDSGRRHALRLVLEVLSYRPEGRGTQLSTALQYASSVLRRRSVVFLVSDFLTDAESDAALERSARRVAGEHDLVPIRLTDPAADALPDVGLLALVDPETGIRRLVNTKSRAAQALYQAARARQRDQITTLLRELRLDVVEVDTRQDFVLPLIHFFRGRERIGK
jgi:uncharacterized protein (DUF58 family)